MSLVSSGLVKVGLIQAQASQHGHKTDGTETYDSETQVWLDLQTEVDPKYGDIAADFNEAFARAQEGDVLNGDFRFGDNGDWDTDGSTPEGKATFGFDGITFDGTGSSSSNYARNGDRVVYAPGVSVDVEVFVASLTHPSAFEFIQGTSSATRIDLVLGLNQLTVIWESTESPSIRCASTRGGRVSSFFTRKSTNKQVFTDTLNGTAQDFVKLGLVVG